MNVEKVRKIFGVAGVGAHEAPAVKLVAKCFRVLMIFVAIWLPLQLYLESKHLFSMTEIDVSNWVVWSAFFVETTVLVFLVKNKRQYLLENWLNLVIIVGGFPLVWEYTAVTAILRWARFLLVFRLIVRVWDASISILSRNHLGATLIVFFIITIIWGVVISIIEPDIHTPWDGVWLAWETVTTVGYGDIIPHTVLGRILSVILMLMGLAIISLLTANFSAYFINKGIQQPKTSPQILKLLNEIQLQLAVIQSRLDHKEDQADS